MKFLRPALRVLLLAGVVSAAFIPLARSATTTWSQPLSGDYNWNDAANWGGTLPSQGSSIIAYMGNVTNGGTRTVIIGSTDIVSAKALTMSQTVAGANNLSILAGGTLTIGQNGAGLQIIGTLANGGTSRIDLAGTLAFAQAASFVFNSDISMVDGAKMSSVTTGTYSYNGVVNTDGVAQIAGVGTIVQFGSSSVLNINSGMLEFYASSTTGLSSVTLGGASKIVAGSTLRVSTPSSGGGSATTVFVNAGTLTQSGVVSMNGRGAGGTQTMTNSGLWVVSGSGAVIEKVTNSSSKDPIFTNTVGGIIRGVGTLTYNHLQTPGTKLVSTNAGTIQMGDGSQGAGTASIGNLELKNFALTLASTSKLEFDLGGLTSGLYDTFTLTSSTMTLGGDLYIYLVNGFDPTSDFSLDLILGGSTVTGSFTNLWVNGVSDSRYSFSVNSGVGTLAFTSVPEPQVWHLLAAGVVFGLWSIRRRRNGTGQL